MPVTLRNSRIFCFSGLFLLVLMMISIPVKAQVPDLEVFVGDTTGTSGEQNSAISIFLNNYFDNEVAGYTLWINLGNPDIMEFQTHLDTIAYLNYYRYTEFDPINPDSAIDSVVASLYWVCQDYSGETCTDSIQLLGYYHCNNFDINGTDTTCTDSTFIEGYDAEHTDTLEAYVGSIDTSGTLTSGWQKVETRSIGGQGQDMLIVALANVAAPPYHSGISPQWGSSTPLIKIQGDIFEIADSDTNRSVDIRIEYNILDFFSFSDEDGNSYGIITDTVPDTTMYECLDWIVQGTDSICNWWQRTLDPESADSMKIVDLAVGHLDTNKVKIYNGSMYVLRGICGDVSGSVSGEPDGSVNLLDILFLINYKYKDGPPPVSEPLSDVNCDIKINLLDILALIDYKYKDGPPLNCCPALWP